MEPTFRETRRPQGLLREGEAGRARRSRRRRGGGGASPLRRRALGGGVDRPRQHPDSARRGGAEVSVSEAEGHSAAAQMRDQQQMFTWGRPRTNNRKSGPLWWINPTRASQIRAQIIKKIHLLILLLMMMMTIDR